MEGNSQQKQQSQDNAILDQALHKIEFKGLSNDEQKAVKAYENIIQQGLAVFKGKKLIPVTKVNGDAMEVVVAELIKEDQEALLGEFKEGFRQLLKDKIALDQVISQKQKEFNKAVVAEKKAFTVKANKVLSIVGNINQLKDDYVTALSVNVEMQQEDDNTD
tara:strand:- start:4273 stop:4758 length:486 start_codon:yes stop_codon:yes gene_type:complete